MIAPTTAAAAAASRAQRDHGRQLADDRAQVEAEQHEQRRLEQEDQRAPEHRAADPRGGLEHALGPGPEVDAGHHGGEHARHVQLLGRDVGDERRDQRDQDLQAGIADVVPDPPDHHRDDESVGDPAGDHLEQPQQRVLDRERVRDRLDRQAERGQRDRVVDQALALEDGDDPGRRAEPGHHRGGRHRVGRRDGGGERERGRPAESGQHEPDHPGHADDRDRRRADRERGDRHRVLPRLPGRGEEGRVVHQRRQEQHQHHGGRQVDVGHLRDQAGEHAEHDEHDRLGHLKPGCDRAPDDHHHGDGDRQREKLLLAHPSPFTKSG